MSAELDALLRWEVAGGTWEVVGAAADTVTVALCRCDGGEVVDELVLREADGKAYALRPPP